MEVKKENIFVQDYIFLYCNSYSFLDEKTNKKVEGTNLYLIPLTFRPDDDSNGSQAEKIVCSYDSFSKLKQLKYLSKYTFHFEMDFSGKNIRRRYVDVITDKQS